MDNGRNVIFKILYLSNYLKPIHFGFFHFHVRFFNKRLMSYDKINTRKELLSS